MAGITAIQSSLGAQTATPGTSTREAPASAAVVAKRKPKHSLAHPNKFDGEDRAAYPAFRPHIDSVQTPHRTDGIQTPRRQVSVTARLQARYKIKTNSSQEIFLKAVYIVLG